MTDYPSNRSSDTYYYDGQIRNYIIQFMAVFSGLKVAIGQNGRDNQSNLIDVPIRYGSTDRVVAAIKAGNTQNMPIRLPTMAAYLSSIEMLPDARKGVAVVQHRTTLPRGQAFPGGLQVIEREQPIPYMAIFELSIMASNTHQHFQILEQILTLFNPIVQIQTSDEVFDWNRITTVELTGIGLEENYPMGADSRIIQTTLTFGVPIRLSPPTVINNNYVAEIRMRLALVANDVSILDIVDDVSREFPAYEVLASAKTTKFPEN
jgi:hypothetical protein